MQRFVKTAVAKEKHSYQWKLSSTFRRAAQFGKEVMLRIKGVVTSGEEYLETLYVAKIDGRISEKKVGFSNEIYSMTINGSFSNFIAFCMVVQNLYVSVICKYVVQQNYGCNTESKNAYQEKTGYFLYDRFKLLQNCYAAANIMVYF